MKIDIYNNDPSLEYLDEIRQSLFDEYREEKDWKTVNDVPDDDIWNEFYFQNDFNWEEAKEEMTDFFQKTYLLHGYVGRWTGPSEGGFIFHHFNEMMNQGILQDCDYSHFYDEDGCFHIEGDHHDGHNHYIVVALTEAGKEFYENWLYDYNNTMSERELHRLLLTNPAYSQQLRYAEKVYGTVYSA